MPKSLKIIILLVLILAFLACGAFFWHKETVLKKAAEDSVAKAEMALAEEQTVNSRMDLNSPESQEEIAAAKDSVAAGLQEEAATLEGKLAELDASIAEVEGQLKEARSQEDYEYYKSVYDSLLKGKTEVERYIAEGKE